MGVSDLVMEGLNLMLLGMGIVFSFLVMLIFALLGMSRLASFFTGPEEAGSKRVATAPEASIPGTANDELIAVIGAAVARFRATRR